MRFVSKPRLALLAMAFLGSVSAHAQDSNSGAETHNGLPVHNETGGTAWATAPPIFLPGTFITPTGNTAPLHVYAPANPTDTPSNNGANNTNQPCPKGDPVLPATGTKIETYPLFALPGEMGLRFVLYYNSNSTNSSGAVSGHWSDNFSYSLTTPCLMFSSSGCSLIQGKLHRPDGSTVVFQRQLISVGQPYVGGPAERGAATMSRDASTGNYIVHDEDATTQLYSPTGDLLSIKDASGVGWTISGGQRVGTTMTITHTNGQSFSVQLNSGSTVVTDPAGNVYTIGGLPTSQLSSISYPGSPATTVSFRYVTLDPPWNNSLSEVDYNGVAHSYTTYVTNPAGFYGWAASTYLAGGLEQTTFAYAKDSAGNLLTTITNPLGYVETQTYNPGGYLTHISGSAVQTCGATVSGRTYDNNGHLAGEVDNNTNTHAYIYTDKGQLQTETEAYGTPQARTTDYVWDPNVLLNRLLSVTVEGFRKTTYTYNAQNRLASVAVTNLTSNGSANQTLTTTYSYALYGNGMVQTMWITHPSQNGSAVDTYSYDSLGNLTSLTNGVGQTTQYRWYNGLGQVGNILGPNGDSTNYTYDARGRVLTKITYPNGSAATWTYAYDGFGLLASLSAPDGQVTTWNRDPASMRVSSITHNDKDGTSTESFSYDANGDVLEHRVTRGSTVGLDELFHYDALGRVYQKMGQNGQLLTYAYDGNGNPLSISNAAGHTIVYQYDALNRVTETSESGGASPPIPSTVSGVNVPSYVWVPAGANSGPYTVSWANVPYATTYTLQEQDDDGNWVTVQSGSALSWSVAGKPRGTYRYRVQACDAAGCSGWSLAGAYVINGPNPELPAILNVITN